MALVLSILSLIPVGFASMVTGDFSQMIYKPSRSTVYFVLRNRFAMIAASLFLWLAALIVHLTIAPTAPLVLFITGFLVLLQIILGFVMSPYIMFPSNRRPSWVSATEAKKSLSPDEPIIGLEINGDARAFPVNWTFRPHIVEETIGGEPVAMTYCLLSNLGLAFRPELNGQPMHFIMPIQWENNMMIYDTLGKRLIQQIDGKVMFGPDKGQAIEKYPTQVMSWAAWQWLHPDTRVFNNPSSGLFDTFVRFFIGRFFLEANRKREAPMFPTIKEFDDRLPNKTEVIGVEEEGIYRAYSLDYLCSKEVVNDSIGDKSIVIICDEEVDVISAYYRNYGGQTRTFERHSEREVAYMHDDETGSLWNSLGQAVAGPAKGAQLDPYPHFSRILWFIWANFHPQTELLAQK